MMIKYELNRYKKKWFKDYKKIIDNDDEYINLDLSDIYEFDCKTSLFCMTYYDSVDNIEMNKMLDKLYKLKKDSNYKVDTSYRKKSIKNLNYIKPEFDSTGHGIVAKIDFLNDDLLSKIDIVWAQINNDEAVVEYSCYFKKCIVSFSSIHSYIIKNYSFLEKIRYSEFYFDCDFFKNNVAQNIKVEFDYFKTIIQYKISCLVNSHYINKYLLPIKYCYVVDKKTKYILKKLKEPFLNTSFIVDKNRYIMVSSFEDGRGTEYNELIFKKYFNPTDFISLLSRVRMPLYYGMFYQIEKNELQKRIINFLNSRRRLINFSNYKWLLNKHRRVNEKRFYSIDVINEVKIKGFSNLDVDFIDFKLYDGLKKVYDDNIEFIKNLNVINYNAMLFVISFFALVAAIIALFI